jgi:hypothetical protein
LEIKSIEKIDNKCYAFAPTYGGIKSRISAESYNRATGKKRCKPYDKQNANQTEPNTKDSDRMIANPIWAWPNPDIAQEHQ